MSADLFTTPIVNGSGAGKGQNCSVELLGKIIYGDMRHGYRLPCIDDGAQAATVAVNDRTSVEVKQTRRWRLLLARLGACHSTGSDRVAQRMGLWAARSVEWLTDDARVKACNDTLERWLAGEATDEELAATNSEYACTSPVAYACLAAAAAATSHAAYASTAAWAAAHAAATDDVLLDWLDRYLTAWQKIAADEGCLIPEDMEAEYVAFAESLDLIFTEDPE